MTGSDAGSADASGRNAPGRKLAAGEPAPFFVAATAGNPRYAFDTVAGRSVMLVFPGAPAGAAAHRLVREVTAARAAFDDANLALFYVVNDPADCARLGIAESLPGLRWFMDYDRAIATRFGFARNPAASSAATPEPTSESVQSATVECGIVLLDRMLRCLHAAAVDDEDTAPRIARLVEAAARHSAGQQAQPSVNHAPVLVADRIFEPALCRALIDHYAATGGEESGFMREENGITRPRVDHSHKRRRDCIIGDDGLRRWAMHRIRYNLVPLIQRVFHHTPTRIERHIVARYDAGEGGYFRPHRDNTTKGTAHRRFAVTINLNAEAYEGGDLRFPEFGATAYRAPTGGAVVFSCSLLHEALPVTRGMRFAYLPFLYGEAEAALRERNLVFVDEAAGGKVASPAP